jgi:hypothetical protein
MVCIDNRYGGNAGDPAFGQRVDEASWSRVLPRPRLTI